MYKHTGLPLNTSCSAHIFTGLSVPIAVCQKSSQACSVYTILLDWSQLWRNTGITPNGKQQTWCLWTRLRTIDSSGKTKRHYFNIYVFIFRLNVTEVSRIASTDAAWNYLKKERFLLSLHSCCAVSANHVFEVPQRRFWKLILSWITRLCWCRHVAWS